MKNLYDDGPSGHIYLISAVAALAGLLFGYDVGIIAGASLFIQKAFALSLDQIGCIVSSVPFGALVAAACSGWFNDCLGRKKVLIIAALFFCVGSVICGLSSSVEELTAGRVLLGIAVGIGSYSAPMYIAEMSHRANRGALVTLNQLAITIGILVAYVVNYVLAFDGLWRLMLGLGVVPGLLLAGCAIFLPESPRWLFLKGKQEEAKKILNKVHGVWYADAEYRAIEQSVKHQKMQLKNILHPNFLQVLGLGIIVSIFTQAVGINAIIYYAPEVFHMIGLGKASSSILPSVAIGLINVIFTMVALRLLDTRGRRSMLLFGVGGIILSLLVLSGAFAYGAHASALLEWLVFLAMITFVACQAVGTGPACWLIPSEIFPSKMRGIGMGYAVACNWGANVVVAYLFPIFLTKFGAADTFGTFLLIAVVGWILFYLFVPETKGVLLETIEENIVAGVPLRHIGRARDSQQATGGEQTA